MGVSPHYTLSDDCMGVYTQSCVCQNKRKHLCDCAGLSCILWGSLRTMQRRVRLCVCSKWQNRTWMDTEFLLYFSIRALIRAEENDLKACGDSDWLFFVFCVFFFPTLAGLRRPLKWHTYIVNIQIEEARLLLSQTVAKHHLLQDITMHSA